MSKAIRISENELRKLQLSQLDMLLFFKDFCKKNDLKFFLIAGCLIGAVRNGGFIPWDDDIDVLMPRADYEILIKEWKKQNPSERFLLLKTDDDLFTSNIFATLTDTNHTYVKDYQENLDIPHGLVMDIFPYDACPNGKLAQKWQEACMLVYSLFLSEQIPVKHGKVIGFFSKILLYIFKGKKIRKWIWKRAEKEMTKYDLENCETVRELCCGPRSLKFFFPKHLFIETINVSFEGYEIPTMAGYDEYLTIAYGDYKTPPLKEDRVPTHDIVKLELNKPCLKNFKKS